MEKRIQIVTITETTFLPDIASLLASVLTEEVSEEFRLFHFQTGAVSYKIVCEYFAHLVKTHLDRKNPIIAVFQNDELVGVALIRLPENYYKKHNTLLMMYGLYKFFGVDLLRNNNSYRKILRESFPEEGYLYISHLAVGRPYQRLGYGTLLIEEIASISRKNKKSTGIAVESAIGDASSFYLAKDFNVFNTVSFGDLHVNVFFRKN